MYLPVRDQSPSGVTHIPPGLQSGLDVSRPAAVSPASSPKTTASHVALVPLFSFGSSARGARRPASIRAFGANRRSNRRPHGSPRAMLPMRDLEQLGSGDNLRLRIPKAAQIRFNADFWRPPMTCDALRDDQWERLKDFVRGGRKGKRGPHTNNRLYLDAPLWMARSGGRLSD
jgi:hypothetical protein